MFINRRVPIRNPSLICGSPQINGQGLFMQVWHYIQTWLCFELHVLKNSCLHPWTKIGSITAPWPLEQRSINSSHFFFPTKNLHGHLLRIGPFTGTSVNRGYLWTIYRIFMEVSFNGDTPIAALEWNITIDRGGERMRSISQRGDDGRSGVVLEDSSEKKGSGVIKQGHNWYIYIILYTHI